MRTRTRTPDIIKVTADNNTDTFLVHRRWGYCDNCGNASVSHLPGPLRVIGVYRFDNPFADPGTGPQNVCSACIRATDGITLISGTAGIRLA